MNHFLEKSYLVSGGASGLGMATAAALAKSGAQVVIADLNQVRCSELNQLDGVHYINTDVCSESSVKAAVELATSLAPLAGAINCAGIVAGSKTVGRSGAHALDLYQKIISVNLIGTFNVTRLAAAAMADNTPDSDGQRGVIINTSSVAAYEGQVGQAAYSASKAGIAGMTLPIARDLSELGIRCMAIAPGIFNTSMMQEMPEVVRENLESNIPFPARMGKPEEFAQLCLHIIQNTMLNGEVIRIDGALRMSGRS